MKQKITRVTLCVWFIFFIAMGCQKKSDAPAATSSPTPWEAPRAEISPQLAIVTVYPGASPAEVEQGVTAAIEEALVGLPGLTKVESWSASGRSTVMLSFDEAETSTALEAIRARLNDLSTLPQDTERPILSRTLLGDASHVFTLQLKNDASIEALSVAQALADELKRLPGILNVSATAPEPVIEIQLARERLEAFGLSPRDVTRALQRIDLPGGPLIHAAPTRSIEDIGEQVLNHGVKLKDIARVTRRLRAPAAPVLINGRPAARLLVTLRSDDALVAARAVIDDWNNKRSDFVHVEASTPQKKFVVFGLRWTPRGSPEDLESRLFTLHQTLTDALRSDPALRVTTLPPEALDSYEARLTVEWSRADDKKMLAAVLAVLTAQVGLQSVPLGPDARVRHVIQTAPDFGADVARENIARLMQREDVLFAATPTTLEERTFIPDHNALAASGLSVFDVAETLRFATDGVEVTALGADQVPIIVTLADERASGDLLRAKISNHAGEAVPLSSLGQLEKTQTPAIIHRVNQQRTHTIFVLRSP